MSELAGSNPAVKRLRRLTRSARDRRSERAVVVEGPRAVLTALDAGAAAEAVFVEPGSPEALLVAVRRRGVPVRTVAPGVLEGVLSTHSPQPVGAVVARPEDASPPAGGERTGPVLVLAGVGDPGNVGTIIRSAVAAGSGVVLIGPGSADPYGPKAVRASAGTVFHARVREVADLEQAIAGLRSSGHTILGAAPEGGWAHDETDLRGDLALVLGGETAGLPAVVSADPVVSIPQGGPAESLNVAMAATVLLFEAARQRAAGEGP